MCIDRPRMVTYGHDPVARKKLTTTIYVTPEQDAALKRLHARTRVPVAVYIREGIDLVLERHQEKPTAEADVGLP